MVCNYFMAFYVCFCVTITKLARYNEKIYIYVCTLWWAKSFSKRLDRNFLFHSSVWWIYYFVAFSVWCCVKITKLVRYNEKLLLVLCGRWSFLFQAIRSQFSCSLKCMVCNYFEAFSVCCCITIIEFVRYNEKKMTWVPCGRGIFF